MGDIKTMTREQLLEYKALLEEKSKLESQQKDGGSVLDRAKEVGKKVGKWAVTPLISPETMQEKYPMGAIAGAAAPVMDMMWGKTGPMNPIPSPNLFQQGTEYASGQSTPLAISGNVLAGVGMLKRLNKLPAIMGKKDYLFKQAELGGKGLDTTRTALGMQKKEAVSKVANKVVKDFKPNFSQKIYRKLKDPIYEIEFTKSGAIKNTIGNLDKVKEALGDMMTGQGWADATKKIQSSIKQSYGYVKKMMVEADNSIAGPIEAYHQFMEKYRLANPIFRTSKGDIRTDKLQGPIVDPEQQHLYKAWLSLARKNPELLKSLKNVKKYISRQGTKATAKKAAVTVAKYGAAGAGLAGGASLLKYMLD